MVSAKFTHMAPVSGFTRYALSWEEMRPYDRGAVFSVRHNGVLATARHTPVGAATAGRQSLMTVGYAPGVYDLFHVGHLNILRHARDHCDHLIAGVVSDEMAQLAKGRRPVIPLAERLDIVRSLRVVDEAVAEVLPNKIDTWKVLRFDAIFKGDDWRGTPKGDRLERDFAAVGVGVVYFPYTLHTSSTLLRTALERLELDQPSDALVTASGGN